MAKTKLMSQMAECIEGFKEDVVPDGICPGINFSTFEYRDQNKIKQQL